MKLRKPIPDHYTDMIGHSMKVYGRELTITGFELDWWEWNGTWMVRDVLIMMFGEDGEHGGYSFDKTLHSPTQETYEVIKKFIPGMYIFINTKPFQITKKFKTTTRMGGSSRNDGKDCSKKYQRNRRYRHRLIGSPLMLNHNKKTWLRVSNPEFYFTHHNPKFFVGIE